MGDPLTTATAATGTSSSKTNPKRTRKIRTTTTLKSNVGSATKQDTHRYSAKP